MRPAPAISTRRRPSSRCRGARSSSASPSSDGTPDRRWVRAAGAIPSAVVRGAEADETLPPPVAPTASAGTLAPGALIAGRYRIARFIGAGGMGEVYAADDAVLG